MMTCRSRRNWDSSDSRRAEWRQQQSSRYREYYRVHEGMQKVSDMYRRLS